MWCDICPECGAKPGRCRQTGYDDHDRILRERVCQTCRLKYPTVEVPIPGGVTFFVLADSHRLRQILRARLVRGYHNTNQGRYRRKRPRLEVDVRVIG